MGTELRDFTARDQLYGLIKQNKNDNIIEKTEKTIMEGALELKKRTMSDVMTPLKDIFMISINEYINRENIKRIYLSGRSRIPIYDGEKENIVGLIFTKDLICLPLDQSWEVKQIITMFRRFALPLDEDLNCSEALLKFKQ